MPRKPGRSGIIITMSKQQRANLISLARERGYDVTADYIRELVKADAQSHGLTIDLSVDRGGYRGRKKETP